jgi:hypothetical protein
MLKKILFVLSVLLIARGIVALIPGWTWAGEMEWIAVGEIVIGVICFALASSQKTA